MNIAALVQGAVTAIVTFLATKGVGLSSHSQAIIAAGLTLVASYVLPTVVRWENEHAREIGAVLGGVAVGAQFLVSLNLGGTPQAILTAVIAFVAAVGLPAAAHQHMPAPGPVAGPAA